MKKLIDLIGQRFERLTVIKYMGKNKCGKAIWLCICDCGDKIIVAGASLKSGNTKSCGCLKKEFAGKQSFKHGYSIKENISKTYSVWASMIQRCTNPNNKYFKNYGGRIPPITVCDRWDISKGGSFANFLKDMGECPPGLSLDRIDNSKDYYKSNCRWTTRKINNRNKNNNHILEYDNEKLCLTEMAEKYKINRKTLEYRLNNGYSIKEALTIPVGNKRKIK